MNLELSRIRNWERGFKKQEWKMEDWKSKIRSQWLGIWNDQELGKRIQESRIKNQESRIPEQRIVHCPSKKISWEHFLKLFNKYLKLPTTFRLLIFYFLIAADPDLSSLFFEKFNDNIFLWQHKIKKMYETTNFSWNIYVLLSTFI
jgi:hypothetical protein